MLLVFVDINLSAPGGGPMRFVLALIVATWVTASGQAGDNWPQFRGERGEGHSDALGLPITWSETKNIVWKTPIHDKGWSSPVVWGDQVWVTTAKEKGTAFYVLCIDRKSGKILHDIKLFEAEKPVDISQFNSYASPTPVIEEGRIYVHFGTYGTACLDTSTAKTLWEQRDLHCNHWRGPASSPILFDGLLFLTFDGYDTQFVAALDKNTGRTVWKKEREIDYKTTNGDLKKAFSTPIVITVAGQPRLISPAATATLGYEPHTGEVLWKVYHGGMNVAQPPQVFEDKLILCTGAGGLSLCAVKASGSGDVTKTNIEWKYNKSVPSRVSPLLVGDHLYMVNEAGILSCLNARTGELIWAEPSAESSVPHRCSWGGRFICLTKRARASSVSPA